MTLTKIKPVVLVTSIVALLILTALLFGILSSRQSQPKQTPSKTPQNQEDKIALPQAKNFEDQLDKLKSTLPLAGPNYSVKFNKSLNLILAEIDAQSAQEYLNTKKEIEDTIKSKGVNDICSLNIFWVAKANTEIRQSISAKDTITTNCPVVPPKN